MLRPLPQDVRQGVVASYYEPRDGGALQYVFPKGSSIQQYVDNGYLQEVTQET